MPILMGLGNPGSKYQETRHNIGFALVDFAAETWGSPSGWKLEGKSFLQKIKVGSHSLLLAKPQTFMNLSGDAAQALMAYYKIPPSDLIVVVDDIYLDTGAVRIRREGGHGGHNGLRNIIQHCGEDFVRIRIGVGPCPVNADMANFVLGRFTPEDNAAIRPLFPYFLKMVETGLEEGWEKAASLFNRRSPQGG